jgi:hypothetical protein
MDGQIGKLVLTGLARLELGTNGKQESRPSVARSGTAAAAVWNFGDGSISLSRRLDDNSREDSPRFGVSIPIEKGLRRLKLVVRICVDVR